ncbi:MAG: phosphatase PAP2 family protein [Bacteroidetes bacterium]|nr:MAG: phosphatase PAP2 family protein [Bacteroidota bacterium]
MRRRWFYSVVFLAAAIGFSGCADKPQKPLTEQDLAASWADMTLHITRFTPANSPTFASRALGYIGLTMYESIVQGYPEYRSMAGQLNGLDSLPQARTDSAYNWPLALNAAQAQILRQIYIQTADSNKRKIDSLENIYYTFFSQKSASSDISARSVAYGKAVADAIFAWSLDDGGHRGYLKNFDKSLVFPARPGSWKPPLYAQSFSHYPLHPHWGDNRTFLTKDAQLPVPQMIPYDTTETSAYYQQYVQVYEQEKALTQEQKEIAIWWGDDPGETFTPPGHSYYLAGLALKKTRPELIRCAETYARVGLAVADAFINCWKWKYIHFSERPNTFIPEHIDIEWESFWPDPPFPAFPSGHAIQSAAAATVLTDLFGEPFAFTDSAHVGRPRDEIREVDFKPRSYTSFWQVAVETANSRFYGGIHTAQDNQAGQDAGVVIGKNVNGLGWRR